MRDVYARPAGNDLVVIALFRSGDGYAGGYDYCSLLLFEPYSYC
jgi:hypothetical protein